MRNHRSMGAGRRRRVLTSLFASVLAVGGAMLPALPAGAVTCVVNGITNATESQIQDLLDVGGPSSVSFAGDCVGTFEIARNVTVLGSAGATVDGDDEGTVFIVDNGAIVTFRGLHITGGADAFGGGLLNVDGVVTVDRVLFTDNESGYGGAILTGPGSRLRVVGSTFRENAAEAGGAISSFAGEVSIASSSFQSNQALAGGAVFLDASAEGDFFESCTGGPGATITRSTFTANIALAGGAVATNSTDLSVSGSTFTRHEGVQYGGAIFAFDACEYDPVVSVSTSTFTSNMAMPGDSGPPLGGAIFAVAIDELSVANSRFVGNRAFVGGAIFAGAREDLFEVPTSSEDNTDVSITGSTFTGNRAEWDGGAVALDNDPEYEPAEFSVASSTFTSNTALMNGGAMFILDAPVDVIGSTFTRNVAEGLSDGDADIIGGGAIGFWSGDAMLMSLADHLPARDMDIVRSRFISNTSGRSGGAISGNAGFGMVSITGATFTGNRAAEDGGAAFLVHADVAVRGSTFSSNVADGDGGAIGMDSYFGFGPYAGSLSTDRATRFVNNRAGVDGGAIGTYDAHVLFAGVATGNSAGHSGGAIAFDTGIGPDVNLEISAATIERNTAVDEGGGVWVVAEYGSDVYIYDTPSALGEGDPIGTLSQGPVSISYNRVTSNAAGLGGGIHVWAVDAFFIATANDRPGTVTIQRNSAVNDGGGIYMDSYGSMYLDYGVLIASNTYGGVYACGGPTVNATLTGNVGYGIFC